MPGPRLDRAVGEIITFDLAAGEVMRVHPGHVASSRTRCSSASPPSGSRTRSSAATDSSSPNWPARPRLAAIDAALDPRALPRRVPRWRLCRAGRDGGGAWRDDGRLLGRGSELRHHRLPSDLERSCELRSAPRCGRAPLRRRLPAAQLCPAGSAVSGGRAAVPAAFHDGKLVGVGERDPRCLDDVGAAADRAPAAAMVAALDQHPDPAAVPSLPSRTRPCSRRAGFADRRKPGERLAKAASRALTGRCPRPRCAPPPVDLHLDGRLADHRPPLALLVQGDAVDEGERRLWPGRGGPAARRKPPLPRRVAAVLELLDLLGNPRTRPGRPEVDAEIGGLGEHRRRPDSSLTTV